MRQIGVNVVAACFIIDLPDLGGADKLRAMDVPVRTLMAFEGLSSQSTLSPRLPCVRGDDNVRPPRRLAATASAARAPSAGARRGYRAFLPLFQPFTFLERQAVQPMRGPCRLQVRQVWLPWRSVNQIRFWIFSRLGVWPTHAWGERLAADGENPCEGLPLLVGSDRRLSV